MSKGKKVIIAVLVLGLLIAGYFAVDRFLKEDTEDEVADAQTITVDTFTADAVTGINYEYKDESIEIKKSGEKWILTSDKAFPLNQTYAETMVTATADLTAKRIVAETSDVFDEYGLTEPAESYIFTCNDGSKVTVDIGAHNDFSDTYYLNVEGTQTVYLVAAEYVDNFHYTVSDLADVESVPTVSSADITAVKVKTENSSFEFANHPDGVANTYSTGYTWAMKDGTILDSNSVTTFFTTLTGFNSAGCADYKADEEEMKEYGFEKPTATVEISYTSTEDKETGELDDDGNEITEAVTKSGTIKLAVGKEATEGVTYYAKFDGSDVVYLIDFSYVDTLDTFDVNTLRPMDVCLIDMDTIDSLDVTLDGKTHKIVITRSKDKDGNAQVDYKLDDKIITASDYDDFFSSIQSMLAESTTDETVDTEPTLTVVYHRNTDTFKDMTLSFTPFDSSFCLVTLDGESRLLANKLDVEKVVTAFNAIELH